MTRRSQRQAESEVGVRVVAARYLQREVLSYRQEPKDPSLAALDPLAPVS